MPATVNIVAIDIDGTEHRLQAPQGSVLMEVLRDSGLDVEAVCGGCCACATCHVWVDTAAFGQRGELEAALVGASTHFSEQHSRLSCQIKLGSEHNNLTITVAPEE